MTIAPTQVGPCAWCEEEQGMPHNEGDSHSICGPHKDQFLLNYYWNKLQSVDSYVETQAALFAQEDDE